MAYTTRSNIAQTTLPPFATDLPDSAYRSPRPQPSRRQVQPVPQARPTSAYDHYAEMLDEDSAAGIGAGFMNGALASDDEDSGDASTVPTRRKQSILAEAINYRPTASIPVASPRPGYASKPAVLDSPSPPSPRQRVPPGISELQISSNPFSERQNTNASTDTGPKDSTKFEGACADNSPYISPAPPYVAEMHSPRHGSHSAVSIAPSLPIDPQMTGGSVTPFKPAFLKNRDSVRFNDESTGFIRGGAEGMVIPRRGARGDYFWRRFSTIAKDKGKQEKSSWLKATQSRTKTMSRGVWIISVIFLICIGGGVAAGWYFGHKDTTHTAPKALGGSADNGQGISSSSTRSIKGKTKTSELHVSPTFTVARRALPIPSNHARRRFHT